MGLDSPMLERISLTATSCTTFDTRSVPNQHLRVTG